jgi:hypothetical protein
LTIATRTRAAGTKRQKEFLTLAATRRPAEIEVRLQTLADHGEPWDDERIKRLAQNLADSGVQLAPKRTWPQPPLEPLADETTRQRFLTLMEPALDTLTSSQNPGDAFARRGPRSRNTYTFGPRAPLDAAAHSSSRQSLRNGNSAALSPGFRFVAAREAPRRLLLSLLGLVEAEAAAKPPAGTAGGVCQGRGGQRVSPAVAEMVGWRRERTASMISLGSIPCRYVLVVPRSV